MFLNHENSTTTQTPMCDGTALTLCPLSVQCTCVCVCGGGNCPCLYVCLCTSPSVPRARWNRLSFNVCSLFGAVHLGQAQWERKVQDTD